MFATQSTEQDLIYSEKPSIEKHETISPSKWRDQEKTLNKVKLKGNHYKLKEKTMLYTDDNDDIESSKPRSDLYVSAHICIPNKGESGSSPVPSLKDTNKKENGFFG